MKTLFQTVGKFAILIATMAILTGLSLFLFGTWFCTYPLLRLPPRERRVRASADFAAAGLALMTAFGPPPNEESESEPEPTPPLHIHHWGA